MQTPLRVTTPVHSFPDEEVCQMPKPIAVSPTKLACLAVGVLLLAVAGFALGQMRPSSDMAKEIKQMEDLMRSGKSAIAAAVAEGYLKQQDPAPSAVARARLARHWYEAMMDDLFASSAGEGTLGSQTAEKWLAVERKADSYEVAKGDRLAPMTVSQRAYNAGLWPLAKVAFDRGWETGDVAAESLGFRYSILRNWGHQLAFGASVQTRDQGVRLLATAQALAVAYNLPRGEACEDLRALGFTDCNQVAPDSSDLILNAAKK